MRNKKKPNLIKRLIGNIVIYFKSVISHYNMKIKYIKTDSFTDKVQEYSNLYNEVLSEINPLYLEKINRVISENYLKEFERYLNGLSLSHLLELEIEIDYYKKFYNDINYSRANNDKFTPETVKDHVNKLYNKKYPKGVEAYKSVLNGKIVNEEMAPEHERVVNKILLYMKESDKYGFMREYIFDSFDDNMSYHKLEIMNYLSTISLDSIDDVVELISNKIFGDTKPKAMNMFGGGYIYDIHKIPTGLRFKDVNPKNILKPSVLEKISVFIKSIKFIYKNKKYLRNVRNYPTIDNIKITSKYRWLNYLIIYIQYLFSGNPFKNYRKIKSFRRLLSDKHVSNTKKDDFMLKMMKSLTLNERLANR